MGWYSMYLYFYSEHFQEMIDKFLEVPNPKLDESNNLKINGFFRFGGIDIDLFGDICIVEDITIWNNIINHNDTWKIGEYAVVNNSWFDSSIVNYHIKFFINRQSTRTKNNYNRLERSNGRKGVPRWAMDLYRVKIDTRLYSVDKARRPDRFGHKYYNPMDDEYHPYPSLIDSYIYSFNWYLGPSNLSKTEILDEKKYDYRVSEEDVYSNKFVFYFDYEAGAYNVNYMNNFISNTDSRSYVTPNTTKKSLYCYNSEFDIFEEYPYIGKIKNTTQKRWVFAAYNMDIAKKLGAGLRPTFWPIVNDSVTPKTNMPQYIKLYSPHGRLLDYGYHFIYDHETVFRSDYLDWRDIPDNPKYPESTKRIAVDYEAWYKPDPVYVATWIYFDRSWEDMSFKKTHNHWYPGAWANKIGNLIKME